MANKKKRWVSKSGQIRWQAQSVPENDLADYGLLAGTLDDGKPLAVLNAGTPDWCFLGRRSCRVLAEALIRCANDNEFWTKRITILKLRQLGVEP
jgi:hypothetical protein